MPGESVAIERYRVINHVKAFVPPPKRMKRLFPVRAYGELPEAKPRWWRVEFTDGTHKWYKVKEREVQEGPDPILLDFP